MDAALGTSSTPPVARRQTVDAAPRVEPAANVQPAPAAAATAHDVDRRVVPLTEGDGRGFGGELVYRVIDSSTGSVLAQTPSEARLKLRAYIDQLAAKHTVRTSFETVA